MSEMDWENVFEEQIERHPGATDPEIDEFVASLLEPLSQREIDWLREQKADQPERWILPSGPLPESYLSFLRWSNGGEFRNGDRLLQFNPAHGDVSGVRAMMLGYQVPGKYPGILPFAFNGGGIFYAFDMRFRPLDGEYRIVAAESGYPHRPYELETTFLDTCKSRINFELEWDEKDEITRPMCEKCSEYLICPECGERGPVKH